MKKDTKSLLFPFYFRSFAHQESLYVRIDSNDIKYEQREHREKNIISRASNE